MTLEEVARLRLEIMGDEAEQTLETLQRNAKEINSELKLMELNGEKGSETWKELKNLQKELNAEIRDMARGIDLNDASMSELTANSRQLNRELSQLKIGSDEWIDKLKEISQVDGKIAETREEMKRLKGEGEEQNGFWTSFKANFAAAFTVDAIQEAAGAVFEFGKEIFEITAKFEKYETVLKTALGGQAEAVAAMEMIKEIAATTPVSVDEMTDSFIKMVNRGIQPTKDEIKNLADLAASQGKNFDDLIEAVLDAQTGENERLKAFGIEADKVGDQVILGFKGKKVAVDQSADAIYNAIVAMGDYNGVAGMTAEMGGILAGKNSNLGDSFDFLMVAIGKELMPVFRGLLETLASAVEWFGRVVTGQEPLGVALRALGSLFGMIWEVGRNLITTFFPGLNSSTVSADGILKVFGNTLTVTVAVLKGVVSTIQLGIDALKVMGSGVVALSKALTGDFRGAANTFNASVNNLTTNAKKNFGSIKGDFEKVFSGSEKVAKDAAKQVDIYGKLAKTTETGITKAALEEQEKRRKEAEKTAKKEGETRKKENDEAVKYIEDKNIALIKDDLTRFIAAENLKYTREKERITASTADARLKAQQLEVLETTHQAALDKIRTDQATKDKKLADDEAKRKEAEAKKLAADEKTARDTKLKEDKILLDAGFQAEIEKAKLSLSLSTTNAKAQYDAKIQLLEAEKNYRDAKLKAEAAAEKQRVTDSIADETRRAAAHKDIDDKLKSQLDQNEQKLKTDRIAAQKATDAARKESNEEFMGWLKKAQDGDFKGFTSYLSDKIRSGKEANADRKQDNVSFFSAMKGLMTGDFQVFTQFLAQKTRDDSAFNKKSFQDFNEKTQAVGKVAQMGIQALQTLNKAYLEKQESNIKKEKDAQLKAWDEKYKKGLISKDEYEKGVAKINKDSDAKTKQVQKEAFERDKKLQIALALVSGGLAFIKALASGFFPVNLVMAAATAVATGIQVAMIKKQQFQGAKGGVIRNAGVVQGGLHGQQYGEGGISMIDRKTGSEVGEIEGGEPVMVLSRNTYKNNKPVVDKLLHSSLHKNGAPIMKNGGIVTLGQANGFFEDGGVYYGRPEYKEPEPERASYDGGGGGGGGDYSGGDSDTGAAIDNSEAEARIAENTALQKEQLQLLKDIKEGIGILAMMLREGNGERRGHTGLLNDIRNKPTGPSLHDIVSNIAGMIRSNSKSDL